MALAVIAALVVTGAGGWCYATMLRAIPVTVNGIETSIRINSTVEELLEANEYFGVTAGNLLSVNGGVLKEAGGDRCAVARGEGDAEQLLEASELATTVVAEGDAFSVTNGADVTEPYDEQVNVLAPGLQMESGGAVQYVRQWGKSGKQVMWIGRESGETADKGVVEEAQDFIIGSTNVQPQGKKKYMALTFDDGPSKYTREILRILEKKGAKATFFNLGTSVGGMPELTKEILEADCELASHTNAHRNLPEVGYDELRGEITTAFDAIEGASGMRPQMIRAPYGAFGSTQWAWSADIISCNVLWNIDTLDWKRPGASVIADRVLSGAFNGAIALMHDGGGNREQDIEALPAIIDGLHDAGYELVTVSELLSKDERFPKDVVNGTVRMPEDASLPQV